MPRYVILHHETPPGYERPAHWDLMLEVDGALATWALEREPLLFRAVFAERLADHRLAYLDYEGPVSQDRGTVSRWDTGEYTALSITPERWEVTLAGKRYSGRLILTSGEKWLARFV